jgi:hypothetical protein
VASCLLQTLVLEKVLPNLDLVSIAHLRATCQLVRGAVDGLVENSSRLRRCINGNRKADLRLRAGQPHVTELEVESKPNM